MRDFASLEQRPHLRLLEQGVGAWNRWREENPSIVPDFRDCDLRDLDAEGANLENADFTTQKAAISVTVLYADTGIEHLPCHRPGADLRGAKLLGANLKRANFAEASLGGAELDDADLEGAILSGADLTDATAREANLQHARLDGARLIRTNLSGAKMSGASLRNALLISARLGPEVSSATRNIGDTTSIEIRTPTSLDGSDLTGANLTNAILTEANLRGATLRGCLVYGVSAWGLELEGCDQADLLITRPGEPLVTVDDIGLAQFIYMLINNKNIRQAIDTLTSKVVLVLGRFTPERKMVLDRLRACLRTKNYVPVIFDFEPASSRDLTETIRTLAHLSKFVIVDLTDPRSVPHELANIVPNLPSVTVHPILERGSNTFAMFEHYRNYQWVAEVRAYDTDGNVESLSDEIIADNQRLKRRT